MQAPEYVKQDSHLVVLYQDHSKNTWRFSLDGVFYPGEYLTRKQCQRAAFDAPEKLR